MEVSRRNFEGLLPEIIEAIQNARFVAIDLEFSGIARSANSNINRGRKQSIEERYQQMKEAAGKYQVLQLGITTVRVDECTGVHTLRPYNFPVSPVVDSKLGVDREYCVQASAIEFLLQNGFDFTYQLSSGIPYLSHDEERVAYDREIMLSQPREDIQVDASSKQFVEDFVRELQSWLDDPIPGWDFINISIDNQELNAYQKRLVHQVVRSRFPDLVTVGKPNFIQVMKADPALEKIKQQERQARFKQTLDRNIGLRHIIDALLRSKVPIVGHNLIQDLLNIYSTWIGTGSLPETLAEFCVQLHTDFPIVIDTKFLGTCEGLCSSLVSRLPELFDTFSVLRRPTIVFHHQNASYTTKRPHDAGYDSYMTAFVLTRFMGNYLTHLGQTQNEKISRERVIHFIKNKGLSPVDVDDSVPLPHFDSPIWSYFSNKLRVNGTEESLLIL